MCMKYYKIATLFAMRISHDSKILFNRMYRKLDTTSLRTSANILNIFTP